MPKVQGQFTAGAKLPDRDYVDGDASGPGLNQVLDKTNAAPHVFATVAEAESAEYSEPETVAVAETSQFYVYDSSSALTRDGFWVLNTVGAGRLVSILLGYVLLSGRAGGQVLNGGSATGNNLQFYSNPSKDGLIKFGDNSYYDELNNHLNIYSSQEYGVFGVSETSATLGKSTSVFERTIPINSFSGNTAVGQYPYAIALTNKDTSQTNNLVAMAFDVLTGSFVSNGAIVAQSVSPGNLVFNFYTETGNTEVKRLSLGADNISYMNLGIGVAPTARVHAKGASSTSVDYAFKAENSSGANLLSARNDGLVSLRYYDMPNEVLAEGEILVANSSGNLVPVLPAYGEAYQNDNATETTISAQNTWYEIDNFTTGENQGLTVAAGQMTIGAGQDGVYSLAASISGVPESTGHVFEFSFSVNDTILTKTKTKRKFSSTTDAGSVSLHGLSNLSASDVVKLEIRNITTGTNASFTVENSSMVIHRID